MPFIIDPATTIGSLTLAVIDMDYMSKFYCNVIGLTELNRQDRYVELGTHGKLLLRLESSPKGKQYPRSMGLFHQAIRLLGRRELGHWLNHLLKSQYPLGGAGDHLVSEALYLTDPEGNGIELYCDRPRESWEFDENGIKMDTLEVNLKSLQAAAQDTPFGGLPQGTTVGHIHLRVNDVQEAVEFYRDLLGFQLMALWPGAGFLSAGGYHHHIGVNMWNSRGAVPPPAGSLGLVNYSILLPDMKALNSLVRQLNSVHYPVEMSDEKWFLQDPSKNKIVLMAAE